jgi:putative aldouronate transport system substrate-binding protein
VVYVPDAPDPRQFSSVVHGEEEQLLAVGLDDPTNGFESTTDNQKGPQITQAFTDRINDIIAGRAPMSSYGDAVSAWRSAGGDQIRKEFQQAMNT